MEILKVIKLIDPPCIHCDKVNNNKKLLVFRKKSINPNN